MLPNAKHIRRVVCTIALATVVSTTSARAGGPLESKPVLVAQQRAALAHWPDSIVCRFSPARSVDSRTGLPTGRGESKPYTLIVRLTLAPAKDGLYYYGVGPIVDNDQAEWPPSGRSGNGLKPGAILAFRPDGTPASDGNGECSGKSIEQLTADGLTGR